MAIVVHRFGDAALRAELPQATDARALLAALRSLPDVVDAVVTERHALVTLDPNRSTGASSPGDVALEAALTRAVERAQTPTDGFDHSLHPAADPSTFRTIRVRYDGPDLADVAREARLTVADVVALHAAGTYAVAAIGFLPGFAYLRGLDARLVVPRRATPRPRVAALSVAIAGPYSGVYPFASPGGWHVLGTAQGFVPFDGRSGATLGVGDRVRFVAAS